MKYRSRGGKAYCAHTKLKLHVMARTALDICWQQMVSMGYGVMVPKLEAN